MNLVTTNAPPVNKGMGKTVKVILVIGVVFLLIVVVVLIQRWPQIHSVIVRSEASKALDKGDFKKAIEKYGELLELHPNDEFSLHNLGVAYTLNKQPEKARVSVQKLKKLGYSEEAKNLEDFIKKKSSGQ